jgi:hypothetical protein
MLVTVWVACAVGGWAFTSVSLTALAPLFLLPLPILLVRRRDGDRWRPIDPFEPIWLASGLYGFTYLLVPALAADRPEDFASLEGYLDSPPNAWQAATWVCALGFLVLMYAYFGPPGRVLARALKGVSLQASEKGIAYLAGGFFLLGCTAVCAALVINRGFSLPVQELLSGGLRDATVQSFSGRGYLTVGFALLALAVPCAALWACETPHRRKWVTVGVMCAIALLLLGAVIGSRILALGIPVGTLAVIHYRYRRIPTLGVGAGVLTLAVAAVLISAARGTGSIADPIAAIGTLGLTLDGFAFLVNAIARVDDFHWGSTIAEDLVFTYLPRALWEGKPVIFGYVAAQEAITPGLYADFLGRATYPSGVLAEGYVNFGVAGSLLAAAAVGALSRGLFVSARHGKAAYCLLLLAWLEANMVNLFRGIGFLAPQFVLTAIVLAPLLLAQRFSRSAAEHGVTAKRVGQKTQT